MQELIVGNHDTIMLFGSDIQSDLRDFSKSMSNILLRKNSELDCLLASVLRELNEFQNDTSRFPLTKGSRKARLNKYRQLIEYIDKITLALQFQQAQLIKESKILESLGKLVEECGEALDESILYAENLLEGIPSSTTDDNINLWVSRLEHKLSDLRISKTISLQSKAQILLLQKNDLLLIDKTATAISQTIPMWRNQVCIMLGADELAHSSKIQSELSVAITDNIKENSKRIRHLSKNKKTDKSIDITHIENANENLKLALSELSKMQDEDIALKEKMIDILN